MVKHTQTIRWLLPTNCLSVFDHFVGFLLKRLKWLEKSLDQKFILGDGVCWGHTMCQQLSISQKLRLNFSIGVMLSHKKPRF